jgi:hypothetical protein
VSVAEARRRLLHDVGKYVARTAKNVRPNEDVPGVLTGMLARDLFELRDGTRASAVFAELSEGAGEDPKLEEVRSLLAEADDIEPRLRAGDRAAVRRGAEIALRVEALLRELALGGER